MVRSASFFVAGVVLLSSVSSMASAALPVLCRATSLVAVLASATTALLQCGWALGRCEVGNGEDDGFEELDPFSTSPRFVLAAARRWCVASH